MIYPSGATSISVRVLWLDDSGFAVTGKVAADWPAVKWGSNNNVADTAITIFDLAAITDAHPNDNTAGGVYEYGNGEYRLDLPNTVGAAADGMRYLQFAETTDKRLSLMGELQIGNIPADSVEIGSAPQTGFDIHSILGPHGGVNVDEYYDSPGTGFQQFPSRFGILNIGTLGGVPSDGILDGSGNTYFRAPSNFNILQINNSGYARAVNDADATIASQADILAINQSASKHLLLTTVAQYERPESGTVVYTVEVRTFAADTGATVDADSTPTLTATGQTSGSLSANIGAATHPETGVYRFPYTVHAADVIEPIRFDVSADIASTTFTLSAYTQVADFVATTFTTADRTTLQAAATATALAAVATNAATAATQSTTAATQATAAASSAATAATQTTATNIRGDLGLASANLDTQLDALAPEATANTIATAVAAIQAKTDLLPSVAAGQTNGLLILRAIAELTQGIPSVTPDIEKLAMLLYMALRNNSEADSAGAYRKIRNDAGVVIAKAPIADDGDIFTQGKLVAGP